MNRRLLSHPNTVMLVLCIAAALVNFLIFGLPHTRTWVDASGFDQYGAHLASGQGYAVDNTGFNIGREPGYPFFIATLYTIFGIHDVLAVSIIQALLLGVLGFIIYRVFVSAGESKVGYAAGLIISLWPSYGYYSDELLTEFLFAFLLGTLFYLSVRILQLGERAPWWLYALTGAVGAYATLVRTQLVFFMPLLLVGYWLYRRGWPLERFKRTLVGFGVFALMILSWMSVVYVNIGHFAITEGRPAAALYFRAVRAQYSYADNTRYLIAWLTRSVTGQETSDVPILDNNDEHHLARAYWALATSSAAIATTEQWSIHTILENPGHYLYGNAIEVVRLAYIDHDYSSYVNRYVRAGIYVALYLFFAFGLFMLWRVRGHKELKTLSALALLFIIYNYLVLTPFYVDPRYNTPYHMFYLIVGFSGVALYLHKKRSVA